jgi:uncharacterized protein (TIGR01777 family)
LSFYNLSVVRVAITGATGLIGSALAHALLARGDEVVGLTRDRARARAVLGGDVELHEWADPQQGAPPAEALRRADVVVHLLGEPVAQRWTEAAKRRIRDSRVLSTRTLAAGLAELPEGTGPAVLISQSATGYYGPRGAEPVDEDTPAGEDFLASVTVQWEREAAAAGGRVRVLSTRTGVVLARHGGALQKMLPPFKLGVGGPVAGGRQYVPWIHLDDVVGGLLHCASDERATGPVNLTAPAPATNAELSRTLGRVLHRPAVLPVPGLAIRLLYGEMATIVLSGQRAVPARLQSLGYAFRHGELEPALRDVLA